MITTQEKMSLKQASQEMQRLYKKEAELREQYEKKVETSKNEYQRDVKLLDKTVQSLSSKLPLNFRDQLLEDSKEEEFQFEKSMKGSFEYLKDIDDLYYETKDLAKEWAADEGFWKENTQGAILLQGHSLEEKLRNSQKITNETFEKVTKLHQKLEVRSKKKGFIDRSWDRIKNNASKSMKSMILMIVGGLIASFVLIQIFSPAVFVFAVVLLGTTKFLELKKSRQMLQEFEGGVEEIVKHYHTCLKLYNEELKIATKQEEDLWAAKSELLLEDMEENYRKALEEAEQTYREQENMIREKLKELTEVSEPYSLSLTSLVERNIFPEPKIEPIVRIGAGSSKNESLSFPVFLPLHRPEFSLMFVGTDEEDREQEIRWMQTTLFRLMLEMEPGLLRLAFVDPKEWGKNAAPFLPFAEIDKELISGKIVTKAQEFENLIASLMKKIENTVQYHLRGQYSSIAEYNADPANPEKLPYDVVIIFDMPDQAEMKKETYRDFIKVLDKADQAGIVIFLFKDIHEDIPEFEEILIKSVSVTQDNGQYSFLSFKELANAKEASDIELSVNHVSGDYWTDWNSPYFKECIQRIREKQEKSAQLIIPFSDTIPGENEYWRSSSSNGLNIIVGMKEDQSLQYAKFNDSTPHMLVGGQTGSGKSVLLHALIMNGALYYSPDELVFYLMDFKQGVEFQSYAKYKLPHARVISIESDREFALDMFEEIAAEQAKRAQLFKDQGVSSLDAYRQKTKDCLPRIMIVIDEYQEIFSERDKIASRFSTLMTKVIKQGRSYGIHLVLGSQTLSTGGNMEKSTFDQIAIRVALSCSEADSRLILAGDNPAARLLSGRPGEAIYNDAKGKIEGNSRFQVAFLNQKAEEDIRYLQLIESLALSHPVHQLPDQVVFEGSRVESMDQNSYISQYQADQMQRSTPFVWLGSPFAVRNEPVTANFYPESRNLLGIFTQDRQVSQRIMTSSLLSLLKQHSQGESQVPLISFVDLSFAEDVEYHDFASLTNLIPASMLRSGKRDQAVNIIQDFYSEFKRRKKLVDAQALSNGSSEPMYLMIYGMQRLKTLEKYFKVDQEKEPPSRTRIGGSIFEKIKQDYEATDTRHVTTDSAKQEVNLTELFREGPECRMHVIYWSDTVTNMRRNYPELFEETSLRVVSQMSSADSIKAISSEAATKLPDGRALYFNVDRGSLVQVQPYVLDKIEWIKEYLNC